MITVHVYDILNFAMGTSDDFIVNTSYDSEYLDISGIGSTLQKATTLKELGEIAVD